MTAAHRRFLIVEQCIGPVIVNFVLNGAIAWLLFRGMATVPLWGTSSIAGDTIATAFLLTFLTSLIATRLVRGQLAQGRVAPLAALPPGLLRSLAALPVARRGAILGLAAVVLAAVPTIAWLAWVGPSQMTHDSFLWFKASWAAALAAIVAPLIGFLALVPAREAAVRRPGGAP